MQHHKVIIVGGGTGGAAVASRLCRTLPPRQVAIIEPSDVHYYQPLWTLVGAGMKKLRDSVKSTSVVLPESAILIKDKVQSFQPDSSSLTLETGQQLTYDHLVLSLGIEPRYDLIPGALTALDSDPRVVSNYSPKYVEKTFEAYQQFNGGQALFNVPTGPIKCAGAPQKAMYLFEDYLQRANRRDGAKIHYFTALPWIFSVERYNTELTALCQERNLECHFRHTLVEVKSEKSQVIMENLETKKRKAVHYDFLHLVPPMSTPDVLQTSPKLTDEGFVDVNRETLQHNHYPNIWALGDCSSLPTSKTAAAISSQSAVLFKNLNSVMNGGLSTIAKYDGYTACPLVTAYSRAMLAEFDYNLTPMETFPFDQSVERGTLYFLTVELLPFLYWDWLLKGLWSGPKLWRQLFHLRP